MPITIKINEFTPAKISPAKISIYKLLKIMLPCLKKQNLSGGIRNCFKKYDFNKKTVLKIYRAWL